MRVEKEYDGEVKIKVQAHAVYQTQYHVVWIPKYRRKVLVPGVKEYLENAFKLILAERYPDVYISEQNIQPDHVHMLVEIPPKYAVSAVIAALKGRSSRLLRKQFAFLREKREVWSVGYFVVKSKMCCKITFRPSPLLFSSLCGSPGTPPGFV